MNSTTSEESKVADYSLEQRALILRLGVYINLRWLVIPAIVGATVVASFVFHITFPTLPVYIMCVIIALYNFLLFLWTRDLQKQDPEMVVGRVEAYVYIQVILDLLTLTALLHFTGGIENPFIFLYIIHTNAAAIFLPRRRVYELTTLAILLVTALLFLEYFGMIPHINLLGFVLPFRYADLSRVLAVLAALAVLAYGTVYVATSIVGELRRRQREVVVLKDRLLEQRAKELEQISAEVDKLVDERRHFVRFLSVVAHDLQSPLVATQSLLSYILDGYTGEITEGQKDLMQRGIRRIDDLLTLITDLLDIPRIEAGEIKREMREVLLNEVVKKATDGLDNLARQKGITLNIELPDISPKIVASSRRMQEVITNLVSNAINYTRDGSVLVKVTEDDGDARFEVVDTGVGILPNEMPKLFEDFFRGSNVGAKGTGLGLSISKRIIEAHGGKIWAESPAPETGKGSKFSFILPKAGKVAQEA
jgi:signal transduction histidine kinase